MLRICERRARRHQHSLLNLREERSDEIDFCLLEPLIASTSVRTLLCERPLLSLCGFHAKYLRHHPSAEAAFKRAFHPSAPLNNLAHLKVLSELRHRPSGQVVHLTDIEELFARFATFEVHPDVAHQGRRSCGQMKKPTVAKRVYLGVRVKNHDFALINDLDAKICS